MLGCSFGAERKIWTCGAAQARQEVTWRVSTMCNTFRSSPKPCCSQRHLLDVNLIENLHSRGKMVPR